MVDIEPVSQDSWLELGIAGAALFIILVVVILMFRQQSKSVDKLCTKIDELVTSFADNNIKLNEVIIASDRDQKETLRLLTEIKAEVSEIHREVITANARLSLLDNKEVDK